MYRDGSGLHAQILHQAWCRIKELRGFCYLHTPAKVLWGIGILAVLASTVRISSRCPASIVIQHPIERVIVPSSGSEVLCELEPFRPSLSVKRTRHADDEPSCQSGYCPVRSENGELKSFGHLRIHSRVSSCLQRRRVQSYETWQRVDKKALHLWKRRVRHFVAARRQYLSYSTKPFRALTNACT